MGTYSQFTSGFIESDGTDIGSKFVTKGYLIDVYPYLNGLGDNIKTAGLWGWGSNSTGQLGDSTTTVKGSPVQTVAGGANWKQFSTGNYHTAAIKNDGSLWVWGTNISGHLGDSTTSSKSSPVQTIAGGTNWKQVSCRVCTAAIKTDGTLWTWGYNGYGQLGDNTTTDRSSPVQTIVGGTNWKQVSCGYTHTAAIKTDGTLWAWGRNIYGQLGDNTITFRSSPVQTIAGGTDWKQVSTGGFHTSAIKADGTLWLWGWNIYGELGNSTTTNKSSPIQTITGGTDWKQVSCGRTSTAAIKTDGTLWLWGSNSYGSLGDSTIYDRSSPVQTVAGGTNWKLVSCGEYLTAAIKTDGTLWTCGKNNSAQLGDNTTTSRSSPIQTIAGGNNWKQVSCGIEVIAAIKEMGDDF